MKGKPITKPHLAEQREYMRAYRAANKERIKELSKRWQEKNGDRPEVKSRRAETVRRHLLKTRGMTPHEFDEMSRAQNGACAICGDITAKLVIDHCHVTRHTRGLLCPRCNSMLGFSRDSEKIMLSAVEYLRKTFLP